MNATEILLIGGETPLHTLLTAGGYFVMTADGNRKKIQLGEQNEEVFEIKSGLIDGERVRLIDFLSMIKE